MSFYDTIKGHPYQYPLPTVIYGLVRALEPEVVVEVGTHTGFSACWIAKALQENNHGRLYCIDPFVWRNEPQEELWYYWTERCGVREWIQLLKGRSQEVEWPGHVDLAFIDGNHTYPVAKHDAEKARDLGATCIVMHDTISWEGSRKYADEARKSWKGWDVLELHPHGGMMVLLKRQSKPESWGEDIGEKWDVA